MHLIRQTSFSLISKIDIEKESTWNNDIFVTIDIDWACDEVLSYSVDLLAKNNVKATWFVTHQTDVLDDIRRNKLFELAIHPNFNFLLNGDFRNGRCSIEVLERVLNIVPEAKAIRSHSMTQSSVLMAEFASLGLKYDCNHFIPYESGVKVKPWLAWNGMCKIPYGWEDDISMLNSDYFSAKEIADIDGLKVLDFHPIHIYLNSECLERYESARAHFRDPAHLKKYINEDFGIKHSLLELVEKIQVGNK